MKRHLNNRILSLLFSNDHMTSDKIAECLDVSSKTVQKICKDINEDILKFGASIKSKKGYGYYLEYADRNMFVEYLQKAESRVLPNFPNERINYILWRIIQSEYTLVDDFMDELYISKSTLVNDMKNVERILADFHLGIERKAKYGIKIVGDEYSKRKCLVSTLKNDYYYGGDLEEQIRKKNEVSKIIKQVLEHNHFRVSALAFNNVANYIFVQISRVSSKQYISGDLKQISDKKILEVAKKISKSLPCDPLPDVEMNYIALILSANQTVDGSGNLSFNIDTLEIANEMIDAIYEAFNIDFKNDLELKLNLCRHLIPLQIRIQNDIFTENPILDDIRKEYPLCNAMASYSLKVLSEKYGQPLNEDEVGFIALSYALALEKRKTTINKKNICLITAYGRLNQLLIEHQIKDTFMDFINEIYTIETNEIDTFDFSKVDYVFSSVNILQDIPVPIIQMSALNCTDQVQFIKDVFSNDQIYQGSNVFSKELFIYEKSTDKNTIIKNMCKVINKKASIPGLYESVLRREKVGNTVFCNQVALSHPDIALAEKPLICVSVLKNPVLWEKNKSVRVVLLVCIAKNKVENLSSMYKDLSKIVTNKNYIEILVKKHNYEALEAIINEIYKKEGNKNG